jgi:hypothetical protein
MADFVPTQQRSDAPRCRVRLLHPVPIAEAAIPPHHWFSGRAASLRPCAPRPMSQSRVPPAPRATLRGAPPSASAGRRDTKPHRPSHRWTHAEQSVSGTGMRGPEKKDVEGPALSILPGYRRPPRGLDFAQKHGLFAANENGGVLRLAACVLRSGRCGGGERRGGVRRHSIWAGRRGQAEAWCERRFVGGSHSEGLVSCPALAPWCTRGHELTACGEGRSR